MMLFWILYNTVCLTISHRINQSGHHPDSKALDNAFHRYRGLMIRSLNEGINTPSMQNGDIVLAGILTLLPADVTLQALTLSQSVAVLMIDD
jgi:hypothetical protein